ncbi:hypothetical protein niasHT_038883 [Heterodera trifolii]|uniref:Trifunctional enzyme subunit alpha, mitochondrial n=1 Tax=Heterodera trifolii TaxID=157864 RepID=A0ABD2IMP9_9BILA
MLLIVIPLFAVTGILLFLLMNSRKNNVSAKNSLDNKVLDDEVQQVKKNSLKCGNEKKCAKIKCGKVLDCLMNTRMVAHIERSSFNALKKRMLQSEKGDRPNSAPLESFQKEAEQYCANDYKKTKNAQQAPLQLRPFIAASLITQFAKSVGGLPNECKKELENIVIGRRCSCTLNMADADPLKYCQLTRTQSDPELGENRPTLPRSDNDIFMGKVYVLGRINGILTVFLVDTGSPFCLISAQYIDEVNRGVRLNTNLRFTLYGVGTASERTLGRAKDVRMRIGNSTITCDCDCIRDPSYHVLLGCNVLQDQHTSISFQQRTVTFRDGHSTTFLTEAEFRRRFGRPVAINPGTSSVGSLRALGYFLPQRAVLDDLRKTFDAIEQNASVRGVVLMSGKPNSFIAGADIGMLSRCATAEAAARISRDAKIHFERMEASKKPMALACHYRIAVSSPETLFALPDVMLGLLPCAGGTQRLPRLISLQNALDMMLTGKVVKPDKAKKMGLVDQLVQPFGLHLTDPLGRTHRYLEEVAISTCEQITAGTMKINSGPPLMGRMQNALLTRKPLLDNVMRMARDKVMKQTHGNYPAPLRILDVVRTGLVDGQKEGYEEETKAFGYLTQTAQSKALIGLIKGQTECKSSKHGEARKTECLAIIGAGLTGAGIANVSIAKDIETILIDTKQETLDSGLKQITTQMEDQIKRKQISAAENEIFLSNLNSELNGFDQLQKVDFVVETYSDDIESKQEMIKKLEKVVPNHCIIATNTSALPIRDIASAAQRPERVIGMHYFSPVGKMQLLEIIVSEKTSKEALAVAAKLGLDQNKLIVLVKDGPGFFVARCLGPMLNEVVRLFQEGVSPKQVDKITTQFGFPVGMATLADEIGLDYMENLTIFLGKALGPRVQGGSSELLAELTKAGFKGKKSRAGIYTYSEKSKNVPNSKAQKILARYKLSPSEGASSVEDQQIRVVSRFVNEALICLEEGIISSPSDGDVASVFGLGFPPFWGGPFRFVDLYGAQKLIKHMERYGNIYSAVQFKPCQLLTDYAKSGKKFYS